MTFFGYEKGGEKLLKMEEVSLECTCEELEKLIEFLNKVKEEHMAVKNKTDICHSHFKDWKRKWSEEDTDFIVATRFPKDI